MSRPIRLKKLSVKTVCGKPTKWVGDESERHLMTVGGIVQGSKSGESAYGKWVAMVGSFKAFNVMNGKVYTGSRLFLPEEFTGEVLAKLTHSATVSFVAEVWIIRDNSSRTGYVYDIRQSGENADDPVDALFSAAGIKLPLIPEQASNNATPALPERKRRK
jgi:hypothetical protein